MKIEEMYNTKNGVKKLHEEIGIKGNIDMYDGLVMSLFEKKLDFNTKFFRILYWMYKYELVTLLEKVLLIQVIDEKWWTCFSLSFL